MPNRFKFQGPEGSIIMEFDDNCTVFQVRTLLSQTIDRKVLGLVAAADKLSGGSAGTNQSQHSVIRLLDSQRMKEVDRKVVMMLECEKLAMMTSEGVNKKEPSEGQEAKSGEMETSSTSNDKTSNSTDHDSKETSSTGNEPQNTSPKTNSHQSKSPEEKREPQATLTQQPFPSPFLEAASAGMAPLPFNFNPFLLVPAVLKYCIHFEIDKFNINAEIFSHATMGCNAATMEKVLLLPTGEYMDGSGKFLPIVRHFMQCEEGRAKIYSRVKTELKRVAHNAAAATASSGNNGGQGRGLQGHTLPHHSHTSQETPSNQLQNGATTSSEIQSFPGANKQINNNNMMQHNLNSLNDLFPNSRNTQNVFGALNSLHLLGSMQRDSIDTNPTQNLTPTPASVLSVTSLANATTAGVASNQPQISPNSSSLSGKASSYFSTSSEVAKAMQQQSSAIDSTSSGQNMKRMRRRTTISRSAKQVMFEWYLSNGRYLTADGRSLLSSHLGLTEENVRVFFKNLRRLEKKCEDTGVSLYDALNRSDSEHSSFSDDLNLLTQQSFTEEDEDSSPTMIKLETIE